MYLYENNAVFFAIMAELVITVTFLVMQRIGFNRMLKECKKGTSDNEIVGKIRKKEINVNSVDNIVNKYVSNFEFCGLKLYTIQRICGQHLNYIFITWCLACIYGVYLEVSIKEILWTTMLGILVVGILFSVGYSVDNSKIEYIAKVNLKNVLEEYIYFSGTQIYAQGEIPTELLSDNLVDGLANKLDDESIKKLRNKDARYKDNKKRIVRNKEINSKDLKEKETPQEKRLKLRKAVFATDKTAYDGKYVVELNNDNLGYLQDYYKEEILS